MTSLSFRAWSALLLSIPFTLVGMTTTRVSHAGPNPSVDMETPDREVSLAELLAFAERHAPTLVTAEKRRGYAKAAKIDADRHLRFNPTFEFGIGPRFDAAEEIDFDFVASLGQPVEIGGERRRRLDAVSRQDDRLGAEQMATWWAIRCELIVAYRAAVIARQRVAITTRIVDFANEMLEIANRRMAAGDASIIDVRVAQTDLAQVRQATVLAQRDLQIERIRLAELTGWAIESPPNVAVELPSPRPVPPLATVIEFAAEHHPELHARRAAVAEAHAKVELADREAWPTPTFGVQIAREGSAGSPANYIVLGSLGLSIPIWQRNQGERAQRRVDETVARAEEDAASRTVLGRIARSHADLASASERLALFTSNVAPSLEDGLALLQRGFDSGELPLLEVALARERFLAAQSDALCAYEDYYRALAELEFAIGSELAIADDSRTRGGP